MFKNISDEIAKTVIFLEAEMDRNREFYFANRCFVSETRHQRSGVETTAMQT